METREIPKSVYLKELRDAEKRIEEIYGKRSPILETIREQISNYLSGKYKPSVNVYIYRYSLNQTVPDTGGVHDIALNLCEELGFGNVVELRRAARPAACYLIRCRVAAPGPDQDEKISNDIRGLTPSERLEIFSHWDEHPP